MRTPLVVSGLIFTIIAVVHALRLFYHWTVVINGFIVTEPVSIVGLIISVFLALWMFCAACRSCKKKAEK